MYPACCDNSRVLFVVVLLILAAFFVYIYRYWLSEKSKGRSPKLLPALFRILWPKVLLNLFLAAMKVSVCPLSEGTRDRCKHRHTHVSMV